MYFIRVLDFKCNIPGVSTVNEDGSYTIFINARICCERQKEAFLHELEHIANNDFCGYNVDKIELLAHSL